MIEFAWADFLVAALASQLFLAAAIQDWHARRADNWIWLFMLGVGGAAVAMHPVALATGLVAVIVGCLWWYLDAGGADAKAIMASGFLFPDAFLWVLLFLAASIGGLVWLGLTRDRTVPFLIPFGSAMTVGLLGGFFA